MASRFWGIDRGDQGYVTEGASTGSKDVEVTLDLTASFSRSETLLGIKRLLNAILEGDWPIIPSVGDIYQWGLNHGQSEKDIATAQSSYATKTIQTMVFTAVNAGTGGNSVTIAFVDPGGNNAALSVGVSGNDITVNLATNGSGTITTTRAQLVAAVNADASASALLSASGTGSNAITAVAATNLATGAAAAVGTSLYAQIQANASLTTSDVAMAFKKIENHIIKGDWPPA